MSRIVVIALLAAGIVWPVFHLPWLSFVIVIALVIWLLIRWVECFFGPESSHHSEPPGTPHIESHQKPEIGRYFCTPG